MQFQHDCEKCIYLGEWQGHDLYWCAQGGRPTVIARWGDDGPNYQSGMIFADRELIPALVEAKTRALQRGLDCGAPE